MNNRHHRKPYFLGSKMENEKTLLSSFIMTRDFTFLKVLCPYLVFFFFIKEIRKCELKSCLFLFLITVEEWTSLPGTEKWQNQGLIKLLLRPYIKKLHLIFKKCWFCGEDTERKGKENRRKGGEETEK